MPQVVSFLSLVSQWSALLDDEQPSQISETLTQSWERRERIERVTRRFSELLRAEEQTLNERVASFVDRCAADVRFANHREFAKMTNETREQSVERTITGAGLVMRDQLPLKQRRRAGRLIVDWGDPAGTARWEIDEQGQSAFTIQNATRFAAKHIGGLDDDLAALLAERLTDEFRRGTMELTSLVKTGESGEQSIYEWQSAAVTLGSDIPVADRQTSFGEAVEAPLLVWLRDERELTRAEINKLIAHSTRSKPWIEAARLVDDTTIWVNPDILVQVERFLSRCVAYSQEDRRIVAKEIALTAFYDLAQAIARRGEWRKAVQDQVLQEEAERQRIERKAMLLKAMQQQQLVGSTADFVATVSE